MTELARRGPHRVLRGDLGIVGMRGQVFAPESGRGLPAIAVGHTWLADSKRYRDLLYHFASWGIVAVAPDGNSGVLASDVGLAAELRSALAIVSHVPLGLGAVTVDADRVGVVGHGFGAAAAVLAASDQLIAGQPAVPVSGVAALFPAPTTSVLLPAAGLVTAPGLVVAGAGELHTVESNALPLAQAYGGDVVLRTVPRAHARDLLERRTVKAFIGMNGSDRAVHGLIRAVCTGFLLHTVAGDPVYQAFSDPESTLGKLGVVDVVDPPAQAVDPVSHLLGVKPRKRRGRKR
ncbi:dienelactone hydrolase family protein [Gordonia insulae]|uniref:Alpha/beta hydrolase n=1 Tax=Gordonia insulae TaxID=2420509 RepID=A0A3G8JK07_9ACTN|nr:alpha/beta hydrolase [Gordonia insulae]AZG44955.1 hypothetical protein D7316_01547 [Gordonia insulae]